MTAGLMGGNKGYKKQGWKGMSEDFFSPTGREVW